MVKYINVLMFKDFNGQIVEYLGTMQLDCSIESGHGQFILFPTRPVMTHLPKYTDDNKPPEYIVRTM